MKIKIHGGKYEIKIDDEDAPVIKRLTLIAKMSGEEVGGVVMDIWIKDKNYSIPIHHFFIKTEPNYLVIHKNKDRLDFRKENLALVPRGVASTNHKKRRATSSKYKGVYWHKTNGRWMADIHFEKKRIHIGSFDSEKKAALAYNIKAKELYGEHAYQNIIH